MRETDSIFDRMIFFLFNFLFITVIFFTLIYSFIYLFAVQNLAYKS